MNACYAHDDVSGEKYFMPVVLSTLTYFEVKNCFVSLNVQLGIKVAGEMT